MTSGAGRRVVRRILDDDDHDCVAIIDDGSIMSAAYDTLTTLYGRPAQRESVVAQALTRDTFALREKLVAAAPEQVCDSNLQVVIFNPTRLGWAHSGLGRRIGDFSK